MSNNDNQETAVSEQEAPNLAKRVLGFVVAIAALGGTLFGYDCGIISSALLHIGTEFGLNSFGKEVVTSAILFGGIFGALVCGPVCDRFGRKRTVLAVATLFMFGAIATSLAPDATILTVTRLILGLAVGAVTQIMPVYIAEVAPAKHRGALVVLFQMMIAGGELISYLIGYAFNGHWRLMFLLAIVPALILFLGMLIMPESPRWLITQNRDREAHNVLTRVRGNAAIAAQEVKQIMDISHHEKNADSWSKLGKPWVRPALIAALGVSILCQLTGINAIIYYAPTILMQSGFGNSAAFLASIGVGATLVAMTIVGTFLVDRIGRRRLLLVFIPLSVIALFILGAAFSGGRPDDAWKWVVIISMLAYIAFNVGSLSMVTWLLNSEIMPLSVRGKGTGVASVSMWVSDMIVSLSTLSLIEFMGASGTIWLYGAISIVAFVLVHRYVTETKGRSLEDIEASLKDGTFLNYRLSP